MSSVSAVAEVRPIEFRAVPHKIPTVLVADIDTAFCPGLGIVPDVGLNVGMVVLNSLVNYSHNHLRIAGAKIPRAADIDIRTLIGLFDDLAVALVALSVVVVVPLLCKRRVIEFRSRSA